MKVSLGQFFLENIKYNIKEKGHCKLDRNGRQRRAEGDTRNYKKQHL